LGGILPQKQQQQLASDFPSTQSIVIAQCRDARIRHNDRVRCLDLLVTFGHRAAGAARTAKLAA
jgi:hypothetical protein